MRKRASKGRTQEAKSRQSAHCSQYEFPLSDETVGDMRECTDCENVFDPNSQQKRRAGGRINQCPDCATEHSPKVLGFASGDGKMASLSILRFENQKDAESYKEYFARASGLRNGKSCQLHTPALTAPGVRFRTVAQSEATNHKGKA